MILAILQARVSSSRLPGKVLMPLLGEPMLLRQIERLQKVRHIDRLVVATSSEAADDAIASLCEQHAVDCFRGNLHDVLDRFYQAAESYHPDHVVRLTADCPLADPGLIDQVIEFYLAGAYDYASNTIQPTFPDGLDVEICRFACLEQAWREAERPSQREHVTPFIHQQPERFNIGNFFNREDLSHLRWTVDEAEDFELVTQIYAALHTSNPDFSTPDILRLIAERPELASCNTQYQRNEGYLKSLAADAPQPSTPAI